MKDGVPVGECLCLGKDCATSGAAGQTTSTPGPGPGHGIGV